MRALLLRLTLVLIGTNVAAGACLAQCTSPLVPPPSPVPTRLEPSQTVTYTDGYVSIGNLLLPDTAAPTCGWPLVVHVHRLGSNRTEDLPWQHTLAANGYAVWSYDVRGQGEAMTLNPRDPRYPAGRGTGMYSGHEKLDLAEQIAFVRSTYAGLVHDGLLAVTGSSQGGVHSWFAAALSGRTVVAPGRPSRTFPVVAAVAPYDFIPDPMRHRLRDGVLWSDWLIVMVADDTVTGFDLDAVFRSQVRQGFLAQDPGRMLRAWESEPGRLLAPLLATVDVPIFYSHAYHDLVCSPQPALAVLRELPATTPLRVQFSTIGHNTPHNARERALRDQWTLRWFEHFVYGVDNGIEREAPIARALLPVDEAVRNDPATLWGQVFDPALSAPVASALRFYLHGDGLLSEDEPLAGGVRTIQHVVDPLFGPAQWLSDARERTPERVIQAMPLSELEYVTPVLPADLELGSRVSVDLAATPDREAFSVAALLMVRTPGEPDVMVGHWGIGVRDAVPGAGRRVAMELGPVGTVVPRGSQLVLLLRNLWLREAPMTRRFSAVPLFDSYSVDIDHGAGRAASWLELEVRDSPTVILDAAPIAVDHQAPVPLEFDLRAGSAHARGSYLVLLGGDPYLQSMGIAMDALNSWLPTSPFASQLSFSGLGIHSAEPVLRVGALSSEGSTQILVDLTAESPLPVSMVGHDIIVQAWVCPQFFAGAVGEEDVVTGSNRVYVRVW